MKKSINLKTINSVLLFVFIVLISIFRVCQLKFFTDYNIACDNFEVHNFFNFNINSKFLSYCIYAIILIYLITLTIARFKKDDEKIISFYEIKSKFSLPTSLCFIVLSVLTFFYSFLYLANLKHIRLNGHTTVILTFLSQIFLGIYFLYFFYCCQFGKFDKQSTSNVIFVFPVFFGVMRLLNIIFLKYFLMLTPREVIFNNFKIATITLFMFYFGKFLIGANSKNNEKNLAFFGYMAVFFTFSSVIPRAIIYFNNIGNKNIFSNKSFAQNIDIFRATNFMLLDFFIGVFITIVLFKFLYCWKNNKKNV